MSQIASSKLYCSSTIGFPRIGSKREMKKALESYWSGGLSGEALLLAAEEVDARAWKEQADMGVDLVALDGTLYDHVLDFAVTYLGLVPDRFSHLQGLEQYFACARGTPECPALDMSKYFDTNYHHLAPDVEGDMTPNANWGPLLEKVKKGQRVIGVDKAVPLILGPLTLAYLCRGSFDSLNLNLLKALIPHYVELMGRLGELGVPEVQVHEPCLTIFDSEDTIAVTADTYHSLATDKVPIHLVIPYDDVSEAMYQCVINLPVHAIGFDFCGVPGATSGNEMFTLIATHGFPQSKRLGAGVVDGRSVWKDTNEAMNVLLSLKRLLGNSQSICVQTSTSLQHVPYDVMLEDNFDPTLREKLSFAVQKLEELSFLSNALKKGFDSCAEPCLGRRTMKEAVFEEHLVTRSESYEERRKKQHVYPAFPTTTIGSFPQTSTIRKVRLQYKKGQISDTEYREAIAAEIGYCIGIQEALDLDVLVHGEAERSDMVEYFGLKLDGFAFTNHGWVQSYGSSFPRKDISRSEQARQIGFAIREEVDDLQNNGCIICQVDEPALREGLPLKKGRWAAYLDWATKAFRLATSVARPEVQIVTHLCYSEFEDILESIDALHADVLTIENSRSSDEMMQYLASYGYKRDIGPGVYDVHSPIVPPVETMLAKIESFIQAGIVQGDVHRIHINPDCGLKTRRWSEVIPSLKNMVGAAKEARRRV
ncbi:hypothetical protein M9435_000989 [Picochlorum sp. BPE23]|nr:hypothetical protein M9435_000989 [Picochlorum sp. BPE23]